MTEESRPRRKRGVSLNDLDRTQVYAIHHTGRRWETLGVVHDAAAVVLAPSGTDGAGREASSTSGPVGRHAAPDPWTAPEGPSA